MGEQRYPLTSLFYRDLGRRGGLIVSPDGQSNLESFHAAPFPRWVFRVGTHRLIRTLRTVRSESGFLLEYLWVANAQGAGTNGEGAARLEVRLMVSGRDTASLGRSQASVPRIEPRADQLGLMCVLHDAPPLQVAWPLGGRWIPDGHWYHHIRLVASDTDEETLWSPGLVELTLPPEKPSALRITSGASESCLGVDAPTLFATPSTPPAAATATLRRAIAWTQDGARFAPEPGQATFPDGCEELEAMLWLAPWLDLELLDALSRSMAARFSPPVLPLDAQLTWVLVQAERARRGRRDDASFLQATSVLESILDGTHPAASPDSSTFLLSVGLPGQSFWDRVSKREDDAWRCHPIDIQALWCNALASGEILGSVLGSTRSSPYGRAFLRVAESIRSHYWMARRSTLADDLEYFPDVGWRPVDRVSSACIVALALRFELLAPSRARAALEHVRRHLSFESHRRSAGRPGTLIGLRAIAGAPSVYPCLLGPLLIAHARLYPGAPDPGLAAAGTLRHFTYSEHTTVPRRIDPRPPLPHADPASGNEVASSGVSLAGLAGLIAAALAQDSGER